MEELVNVKVSLVGCDDITSFQIKCTKEQLEFLRLLCEKSERVSSYPCMPIMSLERIWKN